SPRPERPSDPSGASQRQGPQGSSGLTHSIEVHEGSAGGHAAGFRPRPVPSIAGLQTSALSGGPHRCRDRTSPARQSYAGRLGRVPPSGGPCRRFLHLAAAESSPGATELASDGGFSGGRWTVSQGVRRSLIVAVPEGRKCAPPTLPRWDPRPRWGTPRRFPRPSKRSTGTTPTA